jgi:cobalt/nickel transport system permease protein
VINFVRSSRPEILESISSSQPLSADISVRKVLAGLIVVALVTGGALSWFASANPDGLEWSIEKVFGKPELPEAETGIVPTLKSVQEKTAFLPDYGFKKPEGSEPEKKEEVWPAVEPGTSASGIVGAGIVLAAVLLIGGIIRALRRKPS